MPGEDGKAGHADAPDRNGRRELGRRRVRSRDGDRLHLLDDQSHAVALVNDPTRSNMNYIHGGGGGEGGGGGGREERDEARSGRPAPAGCSQVRCRRRTARGESGRLTTVFGLPLVKPPYGRITAINMNTGEHVWMQPIGDTPDNIKNNEKLKGVTIPRTGRGGRTGIMLTKTLLWAGERGPLVTVNGQQGSWFRSYDKATGDIVSEMLLPANVPGADDLHGEQQAVHPGGSRSGGTAGGIACVGAALTDHSAV